MSEVEKLILENQCKILGALSILLMDKDFQLAEATQLAARITRIQMKDWEEAKG